MADLKYYDVIYRPLVTEQSMAEMGNRKYAFFVHPDATKSQIREAVTKMFEGTIVDKVNTINVKPKKRRTRTVKYGETAARKKAIVSLTEDSKEIEVFQGM